MAHKSLGAGLDGILVIDKPVGPTSHDIVALVRRLAATKRVGHGGTLDPFASGVLPVFLGRGTRVVEFHLGDRKAYRATVCFGASSTTDDLEGELTPGPGPAPTRDDGRGGTPRIHGPDLAAPAGLLGDQGRWPAGLRDGPRRRDGHAGRARRHDPRPRPSCRGTTPSPTDRSRSWTSSAPRAPTSGPWPAISGRATRDGRLPRGVAADGVGAVRRGGCRPARDRSCRGGQRTRAARRAAAADRHGAGAVPGARRSRPTRPRRSRVASSSARPRGSRPGRSAIDCERRTGRWPPWPSRRPAAGWRPDKVARSPRPRRPPGSRLMDVVAGVEGLRPEHGPIFAVVGVFDGLHRGHAYLLEHLVREAAARVGPPGGHHVRCPPGRGPHGLRTAAPDPPRRAPGTARRRRRGGDRRPALRRRGPAHALRRVRGHDPGRHVTLRVCS